MIIILADAVSVFGGFFAIFAFLAGLILYVIMAGKTNYANAGIAMGFSILGFICMLIAVLCAVYKILKGNSKKEKIFGIVELILIIALGIYGYCNPAYSQNLNTIYSNFMSIFVTPLWIYVIIVIIHTIIELNGHGAFSTFLIIGAMLVSFVMLGSVIMGLSYLFDSKPVLNWADANYHYYNRRMVRYRISEYGIDDFETIAPINLTKTKDELLEDGYSLEEIENKFLQMAKESNYGYFEYELKDYEQDENNPNIYICEFLDPYEYNAEHKKAYYYCKIDFSNFTIVEFLDNYDFSN